MIWFESYILLLFKSFHSRRPVPEGSLSHWLFRAAVSSPLPLSYWLISFLGFLSVTLLSARTRSWAGWIPTALLLPPLSRSPSLAAEPSFNPMCLLFLKVSFLLKIYIYVFFSICLCMCVQWIHRPYRSRIWKWNKKEKKISNYWQWYMKIIGPLVLFFCLFLIKTLLYFPGF